MPARRRLRKSKSRLSYLQSYDSHTLSLSLSSFSKFRTLSFAKIRAEIAEAFRAVGIADLLVSIKDRSHAFIYIPDSSLFEKILQASEDSLKRDWTKLRNKKPETQLLPCIDGVPLKLLRGFVTPVPDRYMSNVLKCVKLDPRVTERDLYGYFSRFVETGSKKYPHVSFDENKIAFVSFDPNKADAQFALLFSSYLILPVGNHEAKLEFYYSFRSERDIKSELERRQRASCQ